MIRALIVGAGAVGQVYGAHLQAAGVRVGLFVKPKYAADCRRGLTLHRHRLFRSPVTAVFTPDEVLTEMAEVEAARWDLVLLCVPTSALEGDFFGPLLRGAGEATIVTLQPGMHARSLLTRVVPEERLVAGTIAFIAYRTPLGPDALAPGVAYFFPPLAATQLSGAGPRPSAVVELLRRGGCPARVHDDASTALMFSSSLLMPQITALHAAGWSFSRLARGEWLALGARAVDEAMRVAAAEAKARAPRSRHLVRPVLVRLLLALAPKIMPFDLERYLRAHFTKVDAQSRLLLNDYREAARRHGIDASAIERLYEAVYGDAEPLDPMLERRQRIRREIARSIESIELEKAGPGELTFRGVSRFGPSLVGPPGRLHGGLHAYARLFRLLRAIPAHDGARTFPCRASLRLGKPIMLGEPVPFDGRYHHDADGYLLEVRHDETERLTGSVRTVTPEGDPLARFRAPYARSRRRAPVAEVLAQFDQPARIDEELVILEVDEETRRSVSSVSAVVAPDGSVDVMFHCVQLDVVGAMVAGWALQGYCYTVSFDLTLRRGEAPKESRLVLLGLRETREDLDSPHRPVEIEGRLVGAMITDVVLADTELETVYAHGTVTMLPVRP